MGYNKYKSRPYLACIITTLLTIISSVLPIYSFIMYNIMKKDGDTSKTEGYLLAYTITMTICIFLVCIYICAGIISYCYFKYTKLMRHWSIKKIYSTIPLVVVAVFIILVCGISCVFAGFISYEFFSYNCTTTYAYFIPMLIFVILLLISHGIQLADLIIILILYICVIWPLRMCGYCKRNNEYSPMNPIENFLV